MADPLAVWAKAEAVAVGAAEAAKDVAVAAVEALLMSPRAAVARYALRLASPRARRACEHVADTSLHLYRARQLAFGRCRDAQRRAAASRGR